MTIVTVMGLGYVGLPLAQAFAAKGLEVWGYDVSEKRVQEVNSGTTQFESETELSGKVTATTDSSCITKSDFIVIVVPTPLKNDRKPDLSYVIHATETISKNMKEGTTIVLESTTYPGTTEEILKPILEKSGKKFFLGYSPERIDPGNKTWPLEKIPKVVSGINPESLEKVKWLYSKINPQLVPVSSTTAAEATKLVENTFRAVNLSLVNELAMLFEKMGIDTYEVIDAAKTKPFGFMPFYPGPGIGGHCIPVDPFYLSWKAETMGFQAKFIELAGSLNFEMTDHVVELIKENTGGNDKIIVLGVAYKKNIGDTRMTPARIILGDMKADYYDPFVPRFNGFDSVEKPDINEYDCVVLLTDHDVFKEIDFASYKGTAIDCRNFIEKTAGRLIKLGVGRKN